MNQDQAKQIAGEAWKSAANAYRMYPEQKHTFSDYWDNYGSKLKINVDDPPPPVQVGERDLTVKKFMLKKFPTHLYMDCPVPRHHWDTIQEYAEAFASSRTLPAQDNISEFLKSIIYDPYPEDVFLPVTAIQLEEIHKHLLANFNMPIDRLTGHMGRLLRKPLVEQAERLLGTLPAQGEWVYTQVQCDYCNGDGYTAEHSNHPHENGSCDGKCPVQVQCERCLGTGKLYATENNLSQEVYVPVSVEELRIEAITFAFWLSKFSSIKGAGGQWLNVWEHYDIFLTHEKRDTYLNHAKNMQP